MIAGLELVRSMKAEIIEAKCYSLLVVNQVNGVFEVKDEWMQRYLEIFQVILQRFKEWTMQHIPREKINEADALANLGSSVEGEEINPGTTVHLLNTTIENGHAEINTMGLTWDWRNKYIDYLRDGKLPNDPKESRPLRTKAARFCLVDG